jgi:AhpD family alkylhydroperoxidase
VTFQRRIYHTPAELWQDLRFIARQRGAVRRAMRSRCISPAFRERLMMAVTAVNGCRYCSYAHSRLALHAGVSQDELQSLLQGTIPAAVPADETVAVLYAQHWADCNARPDPEATHRLIATYGQDKADAIHVLLRMIRAGNLLGNSWDYLLYRLSLGRLGR